MDGIKNYKLMPDEIKAKYGAPGEYAQPTPAELRHLEDDLRQHGERTLRRMAQGKVRHKK